VIFGDGTQKWAPFRRVRKVGEPEEVNLDGLAEMLVRKPVNNVEQTMISSPNPSMLVSNQHGSQSQLDELTCASCGTVKVNVYKQRISCFYLPCVYGMVLHYVQHLTRNIIYRKQQRKAPCPCQLILHSIVEDV